MVMDFQAKHRRLAFHEVLFASLVLDHGMTWLDWRRNGQSKGLVADFRYRPDVEQARRGVCHPVKDSGLHTAVCALPPFATNRRRIRAGCQGWSILPDDYDFLVHWCRNQAFKQVVEFGPGDSTLALLDAGCRVVSHEHDISWLCRMLERFRDEEHVEILLCPEGCLPDPPGARPDPDLAVPQIPKLLPLIRAVIHLHNTRPRRSLGGLTPAQAYFHHRPGPWSRARRHEIFDWICTHARTMFETKWEMADLHAHAAAWCRSVAAWRRCQHLITVSPKPQPSPLFKTQIRS